MSADARRLVRRFADTGSPRGTVLISHGYGEHSGRYLPLQEALVGAGYDIAFYDHTGHGTSGGPRGRVVGRGWMAGAWWVLGGTPAGILG